MRAISHAARGVVLHLLAGLVALAAQTPGSVLAGQEPPSNGRLAVFIDCDGRQCRDVETFLRTEIDWVDWVRAREDADVHVILTDQTTGSGGTEYRIDLIGREGLEGRDDELFFRSLGTDVEQEALDGLTTVMAVGLARYATFLGLRVPLEFEAPDPDAVDPDARVLGADEVEDPWNLWVFGIRGSGRLDLTDTRDTEEISGGVSAMRVTPVWKIELESEVSRDVVETTLSSGSVFESTQTEWAVGADVVRAVAEHWSVALTTVAQRLPRANQNLRVEGRPGVEYSYFPYVEATRRTLTLRYLVGPVYRDYEESTIFGKLSETRFEEALRLRYSFRQPWGDASFTAQASHMLDDLDQHNVSLNGNFSIRIARGLSLNTRANVSWVADQIYLSAEDETDEEILLNLRTRASDFNYGVNFGFSYRFGSIFNNVVNNRFIGR